MAKMTPEQEAAYALDFGVTRTDLPKDAQLVHDRLAEQRARARAMAPVSQTETAEDHRVIVPRWVAVAGSVLFFPALGFGLVLVPWWITDYRPGAPYPFAVRVIGVILIAAGGIVVVGAFVRFVIERIGIPWPFVVTSRHVPGWWPRLRRRTP